MTATVLNKKECSLLKEILSINTNKMQRPNNNNDNKNNTDQQNDNYSNDNDDNKSFNEDELKAILKNRINDEKYDTLSLKYLFKLLTFYKLEHYMSDLIDYGYRTAISLNDLQQTDFNNLNVSTYDLKKFAKLQAFIKQVMHTLKVSSISNIKLKSNLNDPNGNYGQMSNGRVIDVMPMWEAKSKTKSPSHLVVNHNKMGPNDANGNKRSKSVDSKASSSKDQSNSVHHLSKKVQLQTNINSQHFGPRLFNNKQIQFVEMKGYNYGVPKTQEHIRKSNGQRGSVTSRRKSQINEPPESTSEMADIYVFARKRPKLACEMKFNDVVSVDNEDRIVLNEFKKAVDGTDILRQNEFKFDRAFDSTLSNNELFQEYISPFLEDVSKKIDFNFICFGQTGSGKTHTLFGSKASDGICLMAVEKLFSENEKLLCGFYEIYNGQLYDLFNQNSRLVLREDSAGLVNVVGLLEIQVKSIQQLRKAIENGQANRHIGCTSFNKASSRSHAILQIRLQANATSTSTRAQSCTSLVAKKKTRGFQALFIDLAGSERGIDAQNNQKDNRKEGAEINQSLLALKECIRCIDQSQSHAPFRQSKLTRVLKDCFVGYGRTVLTATVSPTDDCVQYSLNTLQYANRVRQMTLRKKKKYDFNTKIKFKENELNAPCANMDTVGTKQPRTTSQLDNEPEILSASSRRFLRIRQSDKPTTVDGNIPKSNENSEKAAKKAINIQPAILLEFNNSKFRLNRSMTENEVSVEVDTKCGETESKDDKKPNSLFHPSRITMSSTPVHTNQSERNTPSCEDFIYDNGHYPNELDSKKDGTISQQVHNTSGAAQHIGTESRQVVHKYTNDMSLTGGQKDFDCQSSRLHSAKQVTSYLDTSDNLRKETSSQTTMTDQAVSKRPKIHEKEELRTTVPSAELHCKFKRHSISGQSDGQLTADTKQRNPMAINQFDNTLNGLTNSVFSNISSFKLHETSGRLQTDDMPVEHKPQQQQPNEPAQLKSYIQNLEKKLAVLRVDLRDTTLDQQSMNNSTSRQQKMPENDMKTNRTQLSESDEWSVNSINELSGYDLSTDRNNNNKAVVRDNKLFFAPHKNCLKLISTPPENRFMTPNLSPASTFAESADRSSDSGATANALKVSLHQGVDSLHDKVMAVKASLLGSVTSAINGSSIERGMHHSSEEGMLAMQKCLKHPIAVRLTDANHQTHRTLDNGNDNPQTAVEHADRTASNSDDKAASCRRANTFMSNDLVFVKTAPEHPKSINRTRSLLIVAHENQLSDVTETCKQELNLLTSMKDSQLDFDEYLNRVDEMLTRKADSIRDLKYQINKLKTYDTSSSSLFV